MMLDRLKRIARGAAVGIAVSLPQEALQAEIRRKTETAVLTASAT